MNYRLVLDWGQGILAPALFIFIINAILIFSGIIVLWVVNVLLKNMGVVDIGWSIGIFITALTAFIFGSGLPERKLILLGLVALWSFRLTAYLIFRLWKKKEEDKRYATLRNKWVYSTELKIFAMFLLQGTLILILSLPFIAISFDTEPLYFLDYFGIGIALIGILGETVADWQLTEFHKNPKNSHKICRNGLWNKSRHPNYFFEWIFWVGIALIALQAPFGLTGVVSCALMLFLLLFISGIPFTESHMAKSKKEGLLKYQKEVPGFFPRF